MGQTEVATEPEVEIDGKLVKLTAKQEAFSQAALVYKTNSDIFRASQDAWDKKPASVYARAHEMAKHPKIMARIAQLKAELAKEHRATVDRIILETSFMAFYNPVVVLSKIERATSQGKPWHEYLNPSEHRAIKGIKQTNYGTEYVLEDKTAALDKLTKLLGGYESDNLQKAATNVALTVNETTSSEEAMDIIRELGGAKQK